MTNTPNHNYNIPAQGEENWHVPLNNNFNQLDIDVEIRGKENEKSNYEADLGTKYEATDTGAVYYGDGDTWVLADRRLNAVQSNNIFTKRIQKKGPRIVSPSINSGYNSLQKAIDDSAEGEGTIILLAENIKENIEIPDDNNGGWYKKGLTIRGIKDRYTKIEDAVSDGETPVICNRGGQTGQVHELHLENLHITGDSNSGPAISIPTSVPFFTMINCRTEMPTELASPFFSYFSRCIFNSKAFIETDDRIGVTDNTVVTDTPLILDGGNLVRIDRCTFRVETGDTNFAALWLSQINNVDMNQPEFKINRNRYDESAPRNVASCLIDGACGDINLHSPYAENIPDTHFRTARTPLTETGSPRSIYMKNVRARHYTIDQAVSGLYINTDGAENKVLEVNARASGDSYIETPPNTDVTVTGSKNSPKKAPRIIRGGLDTQTPNLPSDTDESVFNPNYSNCLVYHNGAGATIHYHSDDPNQEILYGSPVRVPMRHSINFTQSVPSDWTWKIIQ
jgi:hypothetical protein